MIKVELLIRRAEALIEAYQIYYEGHDEEKGSFLIECAGEAISEILRLITDAG